MVTQRVTINKIVTDFQVKPSDRGEITILNDPGNQTNDLLLQGSKKTAKPSGVEKPLRRLEGNKRCIMHVCETKRAFEFLQSSFLPRVERPGWSGGQRFSHSWQENSGCLSNQRVQKKQFSLHLICCADKRFYTILPKSTFVRVVISFRTSLLAENQASKSSIPSERGPLRSVHVFKSRHPDGICACEIGGK